MSKQKVIINSALISKMECMIHDIQYYINYNASIGETYTNPEVVDIPFAIMSEEELEDLQNIRTQLKILTKKLKTKSGR